MRPRSRVRPCRVPQPVHPGLVRKRDPRPPIPWGCSQLALHLGSRSPGDVTRTAFVDAIAGTLRRTGSALRASSFARGSLLIAAGTGGGQLISIAIAPVLTRLYIPSDYGVFGVAAAISTILISIVCLGYDNAVPLPGNDDDAANLVALSVAMSVGVSTALFVSLWLAAPLLSSLLGIPDMGPFALLISVSVAMQGIMAAFIAWNIRMKAYVEIARNRVTQASVAAVSQVGFGLLGLGAIGLIFGVVVAGLVASGRLAWTALRGHGAAFRNVTRSEVAAGARRYRRFPLMSAPARLLNGIGTQAPLLLITVLFGTAVGGQFALAHRVMALPLTLMATAIGNTYFAEASRVKRDDATGLRRLYLRTTGSIALVATGPILLAAVLSPFVFGIIFGEAWKEAGVFAAILAPMYLLRLMTSPTHSTLDILERQDLHLIREIIRILLIAGSVIAAWAAGTSPVATVVIITMVGVITYSVYGYLTWRAIAGDEMHNRSGQVQNDDEQGPTMA